MPKYSINTVFIEVRFKDSLFFNDMRVLATIGERTSGIFKDSTFDDNQKSLILFNPEDDKKCIISKNRLVLEYQDPITLEVFKDFSNEIIMILLEELNIKTINRIGMRCLRGIDVKNNQEAVRYVHKNYIKAKDENFKEIGELKGCSASFSFKHGDYGINLNINPNLYQVMKLKNNEVIQNISKWQILIDSDVYIENEIDVSDRKLNFADEAVGINDGVINDFISQMGVY